MIGKPLIGPAGGYRSIALETCASTNTECQKAAEEGDPGNLWITAKTQSAARGSRGRPWVSEPGNLFASLLLVNPCKNQHLAQLTFVSAVAVRKAIVTSFGNTQRPAISLKWPNDVLMDGRKISGILLEAGSKADCSHMVIGIGINCAHHPEKTYFPATDLLQHGLDVDPPVLFERLAIFMADTISEWEQGSKFPAIREQWLAHAHGLGEVIRVQLPGREPVTGLFEGIDAQGYLLLKTQNGAITRISAGDVFFDG